MFIDIRSATPNEVREIIFSDTAYAKAMYPVHSLLKETEGFVFGDCDGDASSGGIRTKEDAINLIKAIEKAIELGWVQ